MTAGELCAFFQAKGDYRFLAALCHQAGLMSVAEAKFLKALLIIERDNRWVQTHFSIGLAYYLARRGLVENPTGDNECSAVSGSSYTNLWRLTEQGLQALVAAVGNNRIVIMPKRIQIKRTRGWRMPPHTLNVSRPSVFGNPYRVGKESKDNAEAVAFYERDLQAAQRGEMTEETLEIWRKNNPYGVAAPFYIVATIHNDYKGWDMACFCPPTLPCHADVLLRLANSAYSGQHGGQPLEVEHDHKKPS